MLTDGTSLLVHYKIGIETNEQVLATLALGVLQNKSAVA